MTLVGLDTGVFVAGVFWRHEPHACVKAWFRGLICPVAYLISAKGAAFSASPPQDGLTYSLPLPSASRLNPSMSLASLRLHSPWRTWGSAPGFVEPQNNVSAESAIHFCLGLRNHLLN